MAWYRGPTASLNHIFQKLAVIFGTMVSFGILMQNFYKVTQGNHEKVPSFATSMEGIINQISLQCPRRMMDLEVQQHFTSFTGSTNIFEIPSGISTALQTSYMQLMVASKRQKAKMMRSGTK